MRVVQPGRDLDLAQDRLVGPGNELPLRVWVRDFDPGAAWRPAAGTESICVRDLEVIWLERNAHIETVMRPRGSDPDVRCVPSLRIPLTPRF